MASNNDGWHRSGSSSGPRRRTVRQAPRQPVSDPRALWRRAFEAWLYQQHSLTHGPRLLAVWEHGNRYHGYDLQDAFTYSIWLEFLSESAARRRAWSDFIAANGEPAFL